MKYEKNVIGRMFDISNILFFILFSIAVIYPFWYQCVVSLSSFFEASGPGLHLWTNSFNFDAYKTVFGNPDFFSAYYWTIIRIIIGTALTVSVTAILAYPLSKKYLPYRNMWTSIIIFTMFFSGGLIPTYFLIRNLGMFDTIWALVIPGMVDPFTVLLVRNFFMALPSELEDSSKVDGANDIILFIRIMLPLSKPIIATVSLWTIVGHWNAWFDVLLYIPKMNITVLQVILRKVIIQNEILNSDIIIGSGTRPTTTPDQIKSAVLMLTTLPIICVYPFLQKYFIKGIMIGSLKG